MNRFKDSWGKAKILLSQLLCIGAVFTACTDDEGFNQTTKALQVSVSTESPAESRAIIDGGYLPDGASIGVTLTAEDGTAYDGQTFTNLQYTAAGEGSTQAWSSVTPASLSITTGKVIAYYPYYGGDDFDLKAVPVETASQTDYMYAKPVTGINMVSPAANLTMQHAMTDIRINVKKGTYTGTGEVTKITAKAPAFATSATMDVETGVFANVSGGGAQFVQELTGAAISSGNVVQDFLIVPDAKSTSGEVAIFVIIDGKKFAVTVPYTESFQQGFTYTYNLTLDNAALTLDGVSVAKWGVKAEVDESLQFYDDQYIVEIQVPSDGYNYKHNIKGFTGTIDWGDGTTDTYDEPKDWPTHQYNVKGDYTIKSSGNMSSINSVNGNYLMASPYITKIINIGKDCGITSMEDAFAKHLLIKEVSSGIFDGLKNVINFSGTFFGCTGLTNIPEGLFDKCTEVTNFGQTFSGCKSLTTIPVGLFDHCTEVTSFGSTFGGGYDLQNTTKEYIMSIMEIPEGLFDKNTKVTSFNKTFAKCENLTYIPKGLFDKCTEVTNFGETFRGCKSLQTIPEGLFDNNTKVTSFYAAFKECTSLKVVPTGLFDNNTEVTNFGQAFYQCQTLIGGAPRFANNLKANNFNKTFENCYNLECINENMFGVNPNINNLVRTFYGCSSLQTIPEGLFDHCTEVTSFEGTFYGCKSLTTIPVGLFDKCTEITNFRQTFYGCRSLSSIPEGLFDNNTKVTDFYGIFAGGDAGNIVLSAIPAGLFDKCTEVTIFADVFLRCRAITEIPDGLFDKNTKVTNFDGAFEGCENLQTIPVGLFDNNTVVTSFQGTFAECVALTTIPEGLFDKCILVTNFSQTFYNCANLTSESPYTLINVDGVDTKVHLYERTNYPENFTATPTSFSRCFYNCSGLTDYSYIPTDWK